MMHKAMNAEVKAVGDGDEGVFEAVVAVFGNVDRIGDRIMPGAFTEDLANWAAKGDPLPTVWAHNADSPQNHIGYVVEARETEAGLWIRAQLDVDADPAESNARQVWRLLKGRRITQFSFKYEVLDAAMVQEDGESIYELRKLKVFEVGPCLIGVNPDTELLNVKSLNEISARLHAGRPLPTKAAALIRDAHQALSAVVADLSDDTETKPDPAARTFEVPVEPSLSPVTVRLLADLAAF